MAYQQQSIPARIDELAASHGDRVWARYPSSPEAFAKGEIESVTFSTLATAINRLAWHLDTVLPPTTSDNELDTICYIGPSDVRYYILACAASKTRRKALFSSPRNNFEAHVSLLKATDCNAILGAGELPAEHSITTMADKLAKDRNLLHGTIPTLDELLSSSPAKTFPWTKKFDEIASEPFLVMHTSGSTGLPKPVPMSHGLFATADAQQRLPEIDGRKLIISNWKESALYSALPPFHSAAFNFFSFSVYQFTQLVFGPTDAPPSLNTVEQMLDLRIADAAILPPSLLAEVAVDKKILPKMSRWKCISYGGGPLTQAAGDALWDYTKVYHVLGATETFNLPELEPRSKDEWNYHTFHPTIGFEYRPVSGEGFSELVLTRDDSKRHHQGAFWTFPEKTEYPMKDLYEEHPSKPGLWHYRGRLDDIMVLLNGEKVDPVAAEQLLSTDPLIRSAMIVGAARVQPALLVEPSESALGLEEGQRKEAIIQVVERANEILPAHAQLHASHVRILDSPDVFLRSAKGELRRAPTNELLADTISEIYSSADQASASTSTAIDFSSQEALEKSLATVLSTDFLRGQAIAVNDNIFQHGFDSLLVLRLVRCLQNILREEKSQFEVTARDVYQHPTIHTLSTMLFNSSTAGTASSREDEIAASLVEMHRLLDRAVAQVDELKKLEKVVKTTSEKSSIVLTGTTGSLGSYILDSLIRSPDVDEIVCLNRSGGDADKQKKTNESRGLSTDFEKVRFLQVDTTKPRLSLDEHDYNELLNNATHIIHNAWQVDFNLPLTSFEPQLQVCHNLIELARASPNHVETTFLSSVGAANYWAVYNNGQVPEELINDFRLAEPMGYAQSKLLAELIFAHASKTLDISVKNCRIGQIAGPVKSSKGMWNPKEWFPSMLLSSKKLGKIPDSLGAMDCMDWVPVDLLGDMLVEVVLPKSQQLASVEFMHFVNPSKAYWSKVVHSLVDRQISNVEVVPNKTWLEALKEVAQDEKMVAEIPAVKLVAFYDDIGQPDAKRPEYATTLTQQRSGLLKELAPVSSEWLRGWMRQWAVDLDDSSKS